MNEAMSSVTKQGLKSMRALIVAMLVQAVLGLGCGNGGEPAQASPPGQPGQPGIPSPGNLPATGACQYVEAADFGPAGTVRLKVEKVVTGLEVPWAIGFLPGGDLLVTERPGRVRRVSGGALVPAPVLQLAVGEGGEGGLLGLAVDPGFASNRRFYLYYTASSGGANVNRLARYRLSADSASATLDRVLIDSVPAGTFHNGGRIKFGPDGFLYVGTGDARSPDNAQDRSTYAGKILRVDPESGATEIFVTGVRNVEGFDWWDSATLVVADHGPTGELGLSGRDEVGFAWKGANLGWPRIGACEKQEPYVTPFISWKEALPPGGAVIYRGSKLPSFRDDVLVAVLGFGGGHLHRVRFNGQHEKYLEGSAGYGRLREITIAPDGSLLVTTSNCDGRGTCPSEKDMILRITE